VHSALILRPLSLGAELIGMQWLVKDQLRFDIAFGPEVGKRASRGAMRLERDSTSLKLQEALAMSNLAAQTEDAAAQAAFRVTAKCQLAKMCVEGLTHPHPERRQSEKTNYEHHLVEAIALALAIKDEFYQGFAIHQVINLCRSANDFEIARTLFKEVDHDLLREQIVKDAPELAGERKKLSDEEKALRTVTIHLDGLDREAIIHLVAKAMRDVGASEREIEGFKEGAINADYDTMLANAIGWGAPVRFLKGGQPWVRGDWRRLTVWQRVKRRWSLWRGSYVHPDGTIELDTEEKAEVDRRDCEPLQSEPA
jgi:hypothetical protein